MRSQALTAAARGLARELGVKRPGTTSRSTSASSIRGRSETRAQQRSSTVKHGRHDH
jgi:hypothetical protein